MARTFTINFTHQKTEHLAVVCQVKEIFCVYLPDEQFHTILPNGRFIYDPIAGLPNDNEQDKSVSKLMQEIVQEIVQEIKILNKNEQSISNFPGK